MAEAVDRDPVIEAFKPGIDVYVHWFPTGSRGQALPRVPPE